MKSFYLIGPLLLLLFTFGCGRSVKVATPEKEADRLKDFLKKSSEYQRKLDKLNGSLLRKRGEGYNTSEAEAKLKQIEEGLKNARRLNVEGKIRELQSQLQELGVFFKEAEYLIKNVPRFGDVAVKKEQIQRKYDSVTQEQVRENRGEPQTKQSIGMFSLNLFLTDPTDLLSGSLCFDGERTVTFNRPPQGEIWTYPDRTVYVFMETNSIVEGFLLRNDLESHDRDRLLSQLCPVQVYTGEFRLIYVSEVGQPVVDWASIMEQIFTGKWRMADMFGMAGYARIAKATAVLPPLTIAALAFDTRLQMLNQKQSDQLQKFGDLLARIDPEAGEVLRVISENNHSLSLSPEEKAQKNAEIFENRSEELRERLESLQKIFEWPKTLNPDKGHLKDVVKVYPQFRQEIEDAGLAVRDALLEFKEEFDQIRKKLLKFQVQFPELVFRETDRVTIFALAEGVRFNEKALLDGSKTEAAELSFKVIVKIYQGKKREPLAIRESADISIKAVNNYIMAMTEYRRLASFGIAFPLDLPLGTYEVAIVLTDYLRVQSTQTTINWSVVPAEILEESKTRLLP